MSKHHRANDRRQCVGGRWAGSAAEDGAGIFPCVVRFKHMPACEALREQARTAIGKDAEAVLEPEQAAAQQCPGCLPREAVEGWLCETCDRYLRQWLGDKVGSLPWVHAWLGSNIGPLHSTSARADWQRPADRDALPSALGERGHALLDCQRLMEDRVYIAEERVRQSVGEHLADAGPYCFISGVAFLRRNVIKIEDDPLLVGELYRKLQDSMIQAHALAPWRKMATKVRGTEGPIPCPNCERKTLMQFSGDDFVTCTTCHTTVHSNRFDQWTAMIEHERSEA